MSSTPQTEFEIAGDGTVVSVKQVQTQTGNRVEFVVNGGKVRTRLDPLELESLTWQTPEFFAEHSGVENPSRKRDVTVPEDAMQIGNEYTLIKLAPVDTATGEQLLIAAPKMGYATTLSPAELAFVARQNKAFFSELLERPLGPEPDDLVEFH